MTRRAFIRQYLRDGLGIEDIAHEMNMPLCRVREAVTAMREAGDMEWVYTNPPYGATARRPMV